MSFLTYIQCIGVKLCYKHYVIIGGKTGSQGGLPEQADDWRKGKETSKAQGSENYTWTNCVPEGSKCCIVKGNTEISLVWKKHVRLGIMADE